MTILDQDVHKEYLSVCVRVLQIAGWLREICLSLLFISHKTGSGFCIFGDLLLQWSPANLPALFPSCQGPLDPQSHVPSASTLDPHLLSSPLPPPHVASSLATLS